VKKQRTSPTIQKPVIDETIALQFASEAPAAPPEPTVDKPAAAVSKRPAAKRVPGNAVGKDARQISFAISKTLYNKIAKEAARKTERLKSILKSTLRSVTKNDSTLHLNVPSAQPNVLLTCGGH
jgi:hypothetical protein